MSISRVGFGYALLAVSCVAPLAASCGDVQQHEETTSTESEPIIAGTTVTIPQNPATVAVYRSTERPCSGTLLRPRWVLTARHCVEFSGAFLPPSQVKVAPPFELVSPQQTHPGMLPPPNAVAAARIVDLPNGHDMVLLELTQPLPRVKPPSPFCNPLQNPSCLPPSPPPQPGLWNGDTASLLGSTVRFMGFGMNVMNGNDDAGTTGAGTLRRADLVIDRVDHVSFNGVMNAAGQSTYTGDSGGTAYTMSDRFGRSLFGIAGVNWAADSTDGSVAVVRNWVKRNISFSGTVTGAGTRNEILLMGGDGWDTIHWAVSNGDGTFTQRTAPASPPAFTNFNSNYMHQAGARMAIGDFDGDNRADVTIVGRSGVSNSVVASGQSNGSFSVTEFSAPFQFPPLARTANARPVTGDFDSDGKSDLALVGGDNWTSIPMLFAMSTFKNSTVPDFPALSRADRAKTVVGDFDGDARDDIALTGGPWSSLPVAFSNGNGTFLFSNQWAEPFASFAQHDSVQAVAGDFDGDGRSDIALVGGPGWASVPVAFSIGEGSFRITNEPVPDFPGFAQQGPKAVAGDFNGDGRDDIALVGGSGWGTLPVAFSIGDGTFRVTNGTADNIPSLAQAPHAVVLSVPGGSAPRAQHPASDLVVGRNADGRMEAFYIGTEGGIYRSRQLYVDARFSGEIPLGGFAKQIALGKNADGRLELFHIGSDDAIYHAWQVQPNGGYSGHAWLGGAAKQFAVGLNQTGMLEVFYVGLDAAIRHVWQLPTGGWIEQHGWLGASAQQVAVTNEQDGRLHVFYIALDGTVWHRFKQPADVWSQHESLGVSAKQIALGNNRDGRIDVFYVTPTDQLFHKWQTFANNNLWSNPAAITTTGNAASERQLATGPLADGRLSLFVSQPGNELPTTTGWSTVQYYQASTNGGAGDAANNPFSAPVIIESGLKRIAPAPGIFELPLDLLYVNAMNDVVFRRESWQPGTWSFPQLVGDVSGTLKSQTLCATATEWVGPPATLTCPAGKIIVHVAFASFGTPVGSCGAYAPGWCHAPTSKAVVAARCRGSNTCQIPADTTLFGDPCIGTGKSLYVEAVCQ